MIVGFEGGLGSGKTVGVVEYLYKDSLENRPIATNFDLYDIEFDYLNLKKLLDDAQKEIDLNELSMGIDEIQVFIDSRVSGHSKKNMLFSYFVLQTRKRNVNLYYTTQHFDMVDKRVYRHTDIYVLCDKIFSWEYPELALLHGVDVDDNSILDIRKYTIIDLRDKHRPSKNVVLKDMSEWYDYYDTNQRILPI